MEFYGIPAFSINRPATRLYIRGAVRMAAGPADRKRKDIRDYIRVPEKADEILAQMHRWIDKTYRVKALVYIKAAVEAKVLTRPPFVVADAEFPGHLGGQSLYYVYAGEPMSFAHEEDLEKLKEAVVVLESIAEHN